jgi:hypothetical protein
MKADCPGEIRLGRACLIRLAINLVMPLYKVLHQEMGLKSLTLVGFATLGTNAMNVEFTSPSSLPEVKKE